MTQKSPFFTVGALVMGGLMLATVSTAPAQAADLASKAEISAAVEGKTFQGSMLQDAFVEYYGEDGSIKGDGYGGAWTVKEEGMCFSYDGGPEACWGVAINGPALTLYKDGKVDGVGILIDGNPNKF